MTPITFDFSESRVLIRIIEERIAKLAPKILAGKHTLADAHEHLTLEKILRKIKGEL